MDLYAVLNVRREATEGEIKRAYKNLAQTFHPDKHGTTQGDGFAQISEAYEVLSHPQKRHVYDVYGKEGLTAGLDLGSKYKSVEEMKKEWEKFKADRDLDSGSRDITHSTHMQCLMDWTGLLDRYAPSGIKNAEIESIYMQSTLDKNLTPHHAGWIGGDVMRSGENGGGNLLAGCRGMIDSKTGYSAEVRWGTKSEIGLQTTRQLRGDTQGVISTTYSAGSGAGLVLSSTQILTDTARGTASLVVGPPHEAGLQLALSQRTDDTSISTKVQVGAMYALLGRVTKAVTPTLSLRAVGRLGFNAIDADIGVVKKLSDHSQVTLSVIYGIQGTYLKTRWNVGNYSLDIPIVFSRDPEEWKVALAAVTLTPLSITLVKHFVVRPLVKAYQTRKALQERTKHAEQIKREIKAAESAQNLQKSVAQRMMKQEALKSGLVVIKAEFGTFPDAATNKLTHSNTEDSETVDGSMPPVVMDVTYAVQYLVSNSELELFAGVSKAGLMGFCDLAPGQTKTLRIQYLYQNRAYTAEVGDMDGLKLPKEGVLIRDLHEAEDMREAAKSSGFTGPSSSGTV